MTASRSTRRTPLTYATRLRKTGINPYMMPGHAWHDPYIPSVASELKEACNFDGYICDSLGTPRGKKGKKGWGVGTSPGVRSPTLIDNYHS